MSLGGVDTNGLLLLKARRVDHHGMGRTTDPVMHLDKHDARHAKIPTDDRGKRKTTYLMLDPDGTDAHLTRIPMNAHPTDGLTMGPVARHVGMAIGL